MSIIYTRKKGKRKFYHKRSSKGTELMNYMEIYCSPEILCGSGLSIREKIEKLHKKYSSNSFYRDMLRKTKPLTKKQIHRINMDYNLKHINV